MTVTEVQFSRIPVEISKGALAPRPVEVWTGDLDVEASRLEHLRSCLDADELARAARFHFERDRRRFIAGRGLLRQLLALYSETAPESLRFGYASHGKPFLLAHPELHFNLSHADNRLMVAISSSHRVGLDIECLPEDPTIEPVARLVFSETEQAALSRLSGMAGRRLFARLWTRKEAYIKADGRGVALRLDHIDVETLADRALRFRPDRGQWSACGDWTLHSLEVDDRYICSLAVERPDSEPGHGLC